jgi:hypothetical protein
MRIAESPDPTLRLNRDTQEPMKNSIWAMEVMAALKRHYPGHPWRVDTDRPGLVSIHHPALAGGKYGYTIHLSDLTPDMLAVVRAGGEILERSAIMRGKLRRGDTARRIDGVNPNHFAGAVL